MRDGEVFAAGSAALAAEVLCRRLSLLVAHDAGAHEAFRATATAVARRHWWSLRRDHLDGSIRASALWRRFSDDAKGQC